MEPPAVRAAAASTARPDELLKAAADRSALVRREVAANPATPPEALVALAADRDWRTRAAVAARRDAPAAAHRQLVHDRVWQVGHALAENPGVDVGVWRTIATEGSRDLRTHLAEQTFLPLEVARLLLAGPETDVRRGLARRTSHREVLEVLLDDPHAGVRGDAYANELATHDDVDRAVRDRDALVRGLAARQLPLRAADLERLLSDRSGFVRDEARDRSARGAVARADGRLPDPYALTDPAVHAVTLVEGDGVSDLTSPVALAHWPVTPRKPSTRWFRLFWQYRPASDEIPEDVARLWPVAARIDRDPAWTAWWEPSPYRLLDVSYGFVGPPGNRPVLDDDTWYASLDDLRPLPTGSEARPGPDDIQDEVAHTYRRLRAALVRVARELGLADPPELPPLRREPSPGSDPRVSR